MSKATGVEASLVEVPPAPSSPVSGIPTPGAISDNPPEELNKQVPKVTEKVTEKVSDKTLDKTNG